MTTRHSIRRAVTVLLLPLAFAARLHAQAVPAGSAMDVVHDLEHLSALPAGAIAVHDLRLDRSTGHFQLTQGTIDLTTQVNGRDIAAVFAGKGVFTFVPPTSVERARLAATFDGADSLALPIKGLVLYFADSTLEQLKAAPGDRSELSDADDWLSGARHVLDPMGHDWDPDLFATALNGDRSGLFFAWVIPEHGSPFMFEYAPSRAEAVSLRRRPSFVGRNRFVEEMVEFAPDGAAPTGRATGTVVDAYQLDVLLPEAADGNVSFGATSAMTLTASEAAGPWVAFNLDSRLGVDSARTDSGKALASWKDENSPYVWIRLDRRLDAGAHRGISLTYHGKLIDRYGDWFFVSPTANWYPAALDYMHPSTFDITYHSPAQYLLASIGTRTDSAAEAGGLVRSHWIETAPNRNAAFNLGDFSEMQLTGEGIPPVTFLYSDRPHQYQYVDSSYDEDGHIRASIETITISADRKHRDQVGQDIQAALKFYGHAYGPPAFSSFYAGEIPYDEGLAFPGMIDLSDATFTGGELLPGEDEAFRAHEVGHQWWGIGVDFASPRDQWLSEGMAEFSGLWFMQTALRNNKYYFGFLDHYRDHIKALGDEAGPMAIGYRASTLRHPAGYQVLTYEKGAWLAHMLRIMMLNLGTMNEDAFSQTMQDFYQSYHGGRASTADFQHVVEKHIGIPMDWFFKEYYEGTALPTYQTAWKAESGADGKVTVHLRVAQSGVPDDFENYIPVAIDLGGNRIAHLRMHVKGPSTTMDVPGMPAAPKTVKFNDLSGVLAADFKNVSW